MTRGSDQGRGLPGDEQCEPSDARSSATIAIVALMWKSTTMANQHIASMAVRMRRPRPLPPQERSSGAISRPNRVGACEVHDAVEVDGAAFLDALTTAAIAHPRSRNRQDPGPTAADPVTSTRNPVPAASPSLTVHVTAAAASTHTNPPMSDSARRRDETRPCPSSGCTLRDGGLRAPHRRSAPSRDTMRP